MKKIADSVLSWLGWADDDYISSRVLLLNNKPIQGIILACTAIEKYLKTILLIKGILWEKGYKGHDIESLFKKAETKTLKINKNFLPFLSKCYKLRYPDDLEVGYNVFLNSNKILHELDFSVFNIRKGFSFQRQDNKPITNHIDFLKQEGEKSLIEKNCYFDNYSRNKLFSEQSFCYSLRVLKPSKIIMQAAFFGQGGDDGKFNEEAFKPKTEDPLERSFDLVVGPKIKDSETSLLNKK